MLEKLEAKNPTMTAIHVFLDNARYHHAKVLQRVHSLRLLLVAFSASRPEQKTARL
jgi:hypothetical protein